MLPHDARAVCDKASDEPTPLERLLRWLAVITMLMTVPQVIAVWRGDAAGVSLLSWLTYLASEVAWLVYGLQKRDATIWAVCIGWIALDAAIVAGIVVHH